MHFSLLLFPPLSASPSALPSYQDAALSDDYPFPVWRRSDRWSSERLRHWDLVTVASLEINLSTSPPDAVLLLMIAVMGPLMSGPPADQWLRVFGCCFRPCHPIWAFPWGLLDAQLLCYGLSSQNIMNSSSARLPILYMGKGTSWLSSIQVWLWTGWRLSSSTAIFQPHQDQFIYISSPCLAANGKITASFLIQRVWHARFGDATPRCDWCRALDLGLQVSLVDENRHVSRWDFQDKRNSTYCFCW